MRAAVGVAVTIVALLQCGGAARLRESDRIAVDVTDVTGQLQLQEQQTKQPDVKGAAELDLGNGAKYAIIPFLVFKIPPMTVERDANLEECEKSCSRDTKCASFTSGQLGTDGQLDPTCIISQGSLTYAIDWTTFSKGAIWDPNPEEQYHRFAGITFSSKKAWALHRHKSLLDCKIICWRDEKCNAISYRAKDHTCLTTVAGLQYTKRMNYYEKKTEKSSKNSILSLDVPATPRNFKLDKAALKIGHVYTGSIIPNDGMISNPGDVPPTENEREAAWVNSQIKQQKWERMPYPWEYGKKGNFTSAEMATMTANAEKQEEAAAASAGPSTPGTSGGVSAVSFPQQPPAMNSLSLKPSVVAADEQAAVVDQTRAPTPPMQQSQTVSPKLYLQVTLTTHQADFNSLEDDVLTDLAELLNVDDSRLAVISTVADDTAGDLILKLSVAAAAPGEKSLHAVKESAAGLDGTSLGGINVQRCTATMTTPNTVPQDTLPGTASSSPREQLQEARGQEASGNLSNDTSNVTASAPSAGSPTPAPKSEPLGSEVVMPAEEQSSSPPQLPVYLDLTVETHMENFQALKTEFLADLAEQCEVEVGQLTLIHSAAIQNSTRVTIEVSPSRTSDTSKIKLRAASVVGYTLGEMAVLSCVVGDAPPAGASPSLPPTPDMAQMDESLRKELQAELQADGKPTSDVDAPANSGGHEMPGEKQSANEMSDSGAQETNSTETKAPTLLVLTMEADQAKKEAQKDMLEARKVMGEDYGKVEELEEEKAKTIARIQNQTTTELQRSIKDITTEDAVKVANAKERLQMEFHAGELEAEAAEARKNETQAKQDAADEKDMLESRAAAIEADAVNEANGEAEVAVEGISTADQEKAAAAKEEAASSALKKAKEADETNNAVIANITGSEMKEKQGAKVTLARMTEEQEKAMQSIQNQTAKEADKAVKEIEDETEGNIEHAVNENIAEANADAEAQAQEEHESKVIQAQMLSNEANYTEQAAEDLAKTKSSALHIKEHEIAVSSKVAQLEAAVRAEQAQAKADEKKEVDAVRAQNTATEKKTMEEDEFQLEQNQKAAKQSEKEVEEVAKIKGDQEVAAFEGLMQNQTAYTNEMNNKEIAKQEAEEAALKKKEADVEAAAEAERVHVEADGELKEKKTVKEGSEQKAAAQAEADQLESAANMIASAKTAQASAEGQAEGAAAEEEGEKTQIKMQNQMTVDKNIITVDIISDVAAYVDSGPDKLGTNLGEMQANANHAKELQDKAYAKFEKENAKYEEKRKEFESDVAIETTRFNDSQAQFNEQYQREIDSKAAMKAELDGNFTNSTSQITQVTAMKSSGELIKLRTTDHCLSSNGPRANCTRDPAAVAQENGTSFQNYDVRITSYPKGRLEMYMSGQWTAVCKVGITQEKKNAAVVCKQMGYASGNWIEGSDLIPQNAEITKLSKICDTNSPNLGACTNGQNIQWETSNCDNLNYGAHVECTACLREPMMWNCDQVDEHQHFAYGSANQKIQSLAPSQQGKCLNSNEPGVEGAPVTLKDCDNQDSGQKFKLESDGTIKSMTATSMCIGVYEEAKLGSTLKMYTCNGIAQNKGKWDLVAPSSAAGGTPPPPGNTCPPPVCALTPNKAVNFIATPTRKLSLATGLSRLNEDDSSECLAKCRENVDNFDDGAGAVCQLGLDGKCELIDARGDGATPKAGAANCVSYASDSAAQNCIQSIDPESVGPKSRAGICKSQCSRQLREEELTLGLEMEKQVSLLVELEEDATPTPSPPTPGSSPTPPPTPLPTNPAAMAAAALAAAKTSASTQGATPAQTSQIETVVPQTITNNPTATNAQIKQALRDAGIPGSLAQAVASSASTAAATAANGPAPPPPQPTPPPTTPAPTVNTTEIEVKSEMKQKADQEAEVKYNAQQAELAAKAAAKEQEEKKIEQERIAANALAKEQELKAAEKEHTEKQEVVEKHQVALDQWNDREAAAKKEQADGRQQRWDEHDQIVQSLSTSIAETEQVRKVAEEAYENATTIYNAAKELLETASAYPANQKFCKLPDMAATSSVFKLRGDTNHEMNILLKFPTMMLSDSDSIIQGWLMLHKEDGFAGAAKVETIGCQWNRNTADFTSTMDFIGAQASVGGEIPDGSDIDFNISLRGDTLNSNRIQGDHICLQLKGGPSGSFDLITSELVNSSAPKLRLEVKQETSKNFTFGTVDTETGAETQNNLDMDAQFAKVEAEIKHKLTVEIGTRMLEDYRTDCKCNAFELSASQLLARDEKVDEKLKEEMAIYRQNAAGGPPLATRAPTPPPTTMPTVLPTVARLGDPRGQPAGVVFAGGQRDVVDSGAISLDAFDGDTHAWAQSEAVELVDVQDLSDELDELA